MRLADDFYFLESLEYERGVFSAEVDTVPKSVSEPLKNIV